MVNKYTIIIQIQNNGKLEEKEDKLLTLLHHHMKTILQNYHNVFVPNSNLLSQYNNITTGNV